MKMSLKKISPYLAKNLEMSEEALLNSFRPAEIGDLETLVEFRKPLFQGDAPWDDKSYLDWRYSFEGTSDNRNCMWVFKKDSLIIGCIGVERVDLHTPESLITAYKLMDVLVDPVLDGKGLGAWMNLYLMERYPVLIAVGSNEKSYSLVSRLFYQISALKAFKLPIRSKQLLLKSLKSSLLAGIIAVPLDMLLSMRRTIKWKRVDGVISSRLLNEIPVDMSQFSSGRQDQIYVDRSAKYLNWRYINNPRCSFDVTGVYHDDSLVGICIYRYYIPIKATQTEAVIFDWFYVEDESGNDYQSTLLHEVISLLSSKGVAAVSIHAHCESCDDTLFRLGFILRGQAPFFYLHVGDETINLNLYDQKKWFLTEGDFDTDLY